MVSVGKQDWRKALKSSSVDGVFVRPFFEADSPSDDFRTVPIQCAENLQSALRQAAFLGDLVVGVWS